MKLARYIIALIPLLGMVSPIQADLIVVPNAVAALPGNTSANLTGATNFNLDLQEVFGSGQFQSVPGELLINSLAFRAAPGTGVFNGTIASANLYLSTTQYAPNSNGGNTLLTDTYATNIGPDNTLVYSGAATLSSPGCPASQTTPCSFDLVFTFSTPFLFNPSQGKLLVDLQATGFSVVNGTFDQENFPGSPNGGSVADLVGALGDTTDTVHTSGNIAQFSYTLVAPEPASCALVLFGIGGLLTLRRRRSS